MSPAPYTPGEPGIAFDLPFADYVAAPGLNNSGLATLMRDPRRYHYEDHGLLNRPPATAAMEWGTLLHERVLLGTHNYHVRPETYGLESKPWSGNAKECKAWLADHEDLPVLTTDQTMQLNAEARCVLENPDATRLLTGGHAEVSLFAREKNHGYLLKGRLDYLRLDSDGAPYIVDLKTTTDASTPALSRELLNRRYHVQFAFYRRLVELVGYPRPDVFVIALEKGDLPRCQVRQIAAQALDLGDAKLDAHLRLYRLCRIADWWPAFPDAERDSAVIRAIDLPEYVYGKTELLGGMTPASA